MKAEETAAICCCRCCRFDRRPPFPNTIHPVGAITAAIAAAIAAAEASLDRRYSLIPVLQLQRKRKTSSVVVCCRFCGGRRLVAAGVNFRGILPSKVLTLRFLRMGRLVVGVVQPQIRQHDSVGGTGG